MALAAGTRLGPYEIEGAAGAGGMGEVYRARDTRLDRIVAVKILPPGLASDPERRHRFEREARVVASLSHPHICALHDVGSTSGETPLAYLVMEYLEGETLAARLARGPLPLNDVTRYGAEIATALHAAHRQQIVHRDLKPGNVMLTRAGVKLLDFGLAKATALTASDADAVSTRALSVATVPGAMLGTLPYMAPEQVEGRAADWRSDIFALGAVLYEMATGRRAFAGDSAAAVASAILTSNPPPIAPSRALDRVVRTCLEKDPEGRWQSAHDVALQLGGLAAVESDADAGERPRRSWLPWTVAATALAAAIVVGVWASGTSREAAAAGDGGGIRPVVALSVPPPPGGAFTHWVEWSSMAVSPDGGAIAYSARSADGRIRIWLRTLGSIAPRALAGTDDATSMFWRPDGRSLAFFAGGRLKRIDLPDGAPVTICTVPTGIGLWGTWGADGQILFSSVRGDAIRGVPATGGTPVDIRTPDAARGEVRLLWPTFLPDGRRFLYLGARRDDAGAVMMAQAGGEPREILHVRSNAQYVDPGYLLYANESTLVARRFDPATGTLSGDPIAIAERVNYNRATGLAHFSASPVGVIALQPHEDEARIASIDRSGREHPLPRPTAVFNSVRVSPNGRRLLFDRMDRRLSALDAWMLDLDRGVETRLTTHPTTESHPLWGPGDSIVYSSVRGMGPQLHRRSLQGDDEEALSKDTDGAHWPLSTSPDGEWLLFVRRGSGGTFDILARRFSAEEVQPFRTSDAQEFDGQFSADGKFVAFVTDETGRAEVVVAPFPRGPGIRVSAEGGRMPQWSPDGRELFYVGGDGALYAVPIQLRPAVKIGHPVRLFAARAADGPWRMFSVAPGDRFFAVIATQVASAQPLTVLVNWTPSGRR